MTRFKPVPSASGGLDRLEAIHGALPLVPADEQSCLGRFRRRVGIDDRETGRAWLTFLRALGLVERADRGYRRLGCDPGESRLRDRFRRRLHGVSEALSALSAADGPLTPAAVANRISNAQPAWERRRIPDPDRAWRDRTRRLLEWCVAFGLVERVTDGRDPGGSPAFRVGTDDGNHAVQ